MQYRGFHTRSRVVARIANQVNRLLARPCAGMCCTGPQDKRTYHVGYWTRVAV